ncbi:hypothetical protein NKH77_11280 [Streptomyces sp. M19]
MGRAALYDRAHVPGLQGPDSGEGRAATVRSLARRIVEADDFRGADFSAGERWLHDCAHGSGSKGSGHEAMWAHVGHVQHMTYVMRQLSADGG